MTRIFISYRRSDSLTMTGRIYDRLADAFGVENVFKDVDRLLVGVDFRSVINREIGSSDVLLAMVGKDWLSAKDEDGKRRLDNPNDFVRLELEFALRRRTMLVVPVLVAGAKMPEADELPSSLRDFVFRHAAVVREDPDFRSDLSRLIEQITKFGTQNTPTAQIPLEYRFYEERQRATGELNPNTVIPAPDKTPPPMPAAAPTEHDPTTASLSRRDIDRYLRDEGRPPTNPQRPNPPAQPGSAAQPADARKMPDMRTQPVQPGYIDPVGAPVKDPTEEVFVLPAAQPTQPPAAAPIEHDPKTVSLSRLLIIGVAILLALAIIVTLLATR
jgi:hypothetical protein